MDWGKRVAAAGPVRAITYGSVSHEYVQGDTSRALQWQLFAAVGHGPQGAWAGGQLAEYVKTDMSVWCVAGAPAACVKGLTVGHSS